MGFEKRGLKGTAITVIVVLIVLIAAILIYNFVIKREKVTPPNPINVQCQNQCNLSSKIGFCDVERKVTESLTTTCYELAKNSQYAQYNVQSCPAITCVTSAQIDQTCVTGLGGTWETPTASGDCTQSGTKIRRELNASDNPPVAGQICCK